MRKLSKADIAKIERGGGSIHRTRPSVESLITTPTTKTSVKPGNNQAAMDAAVAALESARFARDAVKVSKESDGRLLKAISSLETAVNRGNNGCRVVIRRDSRGFLKEVDILPIKRTLNRKTGSMAE